MAGQLAFGQGIHDCLIVNSQYAKDLFSLLNRATPARRIVDYLAEFLDKPKISLAEHPLHLTGRDQAFSAFIARLEGYSFIK
jgi:hypothetical protein